MAVIGKTWQSVCDIRLLTVIPKLFKEGAKEIQVLIWYTIIFRLDNKKTTKVGQTVSG